MTSVLAENMNEVVYKFYMTLDQDQLDQLNDDFDALFEAISIFHKEASQWTVEGYLVNLDHKENIEGFIQQQYPVNPPVFVFEKLPQKNWLKENQASFEPFSVGCFDILPSHMENRFEESQNIPIFIDASTAFGSGEHPTTKGCLTLLSDLKLEASDTVLDMGCGSSILSIAMAKKFHCPTIAVDNDPECCQKSIENIKRNNITSHFDVVCSEGFKKDKTCSLKPYKLIIANIFLHTLIDLSATFHDILASDGYLLLSGILEDQKETLLQAFSSFSLIEEYQEKQWNALLLIKK